MAFAFELAKLINALRYEDLPAPAVHWAKVGILDTVGVTIAGSNDPSARLVARALGSARRMLPARATAPTCCSSSGLAVAPRPRCAGRAWPPAAPTSAATPRARAGPK